MFIFVTLYFSRHPLSQSYNINVLGTAALSAGIPFTPVARWGYCSALFHFVNSGIHSSLSHDLRLGVYGCGTGILHSFDQLGRNAKAKVESHTVLYEIGLKCLLPSRLCQHRPNNVCRSLDMRLCLNSKFSS